MSTGKPVYDAMGNYTGFNDPTDGETEPSPEIAKPAEVETPDPKGGPIVMAAQIKFGAYTMYVAEDTAWLQTPSGKKLQFVLFDPTGVTENDPPNKLSDGSDGSEDSLGGNNVPVTAEPLSVENRLPNQTSSTSSVPPSPGGKTVAWPSIPNMGIGLGDLLNLFNTLFSPSFYPGARAAADQFIGRTLDDAEWANLIAAVAAESGGDPRELAWVAGTIMNRGRESGMNLTSVLNQPAQYPAVTGWDPANPKPDPKYTSGPNSVIEQRIYASWIEFLPEVPPNNYHYNSVTPPPGQGQDCVITQRDGIQGLLVGSTLFFPGARWQP